MRNSQQTKSALILGATGSAGSAITQAMADSGWQVRALTRQARNDEHSNIHWVSGDLDHPESLDDLAEGVDVIVHAVNVPYPKWNPVMVNYTRNIIKLAQAADAHLIFVGNIYNFGVPATGVINSNTPNAPINEKGKIRSTLEGMIKDATADGLRATVMRFGDFFGPGVNQNNWFQICTKDLHKNKLSVAGPLDVPHTWAYLPDAANAIERVATARLQTSELSNAIPGYMELPFQGHVLTFAELKQAIETITGQPLKVANVPWKLFKVLSVVWPLMRDILSMRYLWQHDIQMDESALVKLIGVPKHTGLHQALLESIPSLQDKGLSAVATNN